MKLIGPATVLKVLTTAVAALMLATFLVPGAADANEYYHYSYDSTPCPRYAIQDVFDDPHSDWDGDHVNNSDELYNGMNPCTFDSTAFCRSGTNPLCHYGTSNHHYTQPTHHYQYVYYYSSGCNDHVLTYPSGDYDGDGVSNRTEAYDLYADPCTKPCPNPINADVALNPWGDWDGDGISNRTEVNQGSNPCVAHYYYYNHHSSNPCPHWLQSDVTYDPTGDWDGDGKRNLDEVLAGNSPCVKHHYYQTYTPTYTSQNRLPHVTQVAPTPPRAHCPAGYPYYHPANGKCYANPI